MTSRSYLESFLIVGCIAIFLLFYMVSKFKSMEKVSETNSEDVKPKGNNIFNLFLKLLSYGFLVYVFLLKDFKELWRMDDPYVWVRKGILFFIFGLVALFFLRFNKSFQSDGKLKKGTPQRQIRKINVIAIKNFSFAMSAVFIFLYFLKLFIGRS